MENKFKSSLFLCFYTWTASWALPIGIDNVIVSGGQAISGIGEQFQQWGEYNRGKVVPHYGSYGRERAILESEGKISQLDSTYTRSHQFIADIIGHKPLLDITSEYEKYGNDGEKSRRVSTALISGFDGIANIVNTVLDTPGDKTRYASKQATALLNAFGANIVGL